MRLPEFRYGETEQARDRLNHVRVVGLFGVFDHHIPLNLESRITVIHGPNGVGKTIILRMIHELLTGAPDVLLRVPFEEFALEFKSGDSIKVRPAPAVPETSKPSPKCEICLGSTIHNVDLIIEPDPALIRQVAALIPGPWQYKGGSKWIDTRDQEVVTSDALFNRYGDNVPEALRAKLKSSSDPIFEQFCKNKCRIRLIGTDRLLTDERERHAGRVRAGRLAPRDMESAEWVSLPRRIGSFKQRIAAYSQDLIYRLREALSEYGRLTEVLDRSLVRRLIDQDQDQDKNSPEQLLSLLKNLDDKRRQLTSLGLLDEAEDVLGTDATDDEVIRLVKYRTDVFSLYVRDMQKKLALFDHLRNKLEILRGRIDQRIQFKKLAIDPKEGFVFQSDAGDKVAASDLSSGEQHEMILLYELLFMVQEGDLVLIDEPEISLHMEWQMKLFDDLRAVLQASSIDVLMATHSPAIASGTKGILVPLGTHGG